VDLVTAWRAPAQGKALRWFIERLRDPGLAAALLG